MDNLLAIGLSRQLTLRRSLEVIANNVANMNTTGFKRDVAQTLEDPTRRAETVDGPRRVAFTKADRVMRDFAEGVLVATGRPLDFAVDGEAFFTVRFEDGAAYTRDGSFNRDPDGRLVTQDGRAVLDEADQEIILPDGGVIGVTPDGELRVDDQPIARLGLATFADRAGLEKRGDNLFLNTGGAPLRLEQPNVLQGTLEQSNVNGVREITTMIEIQRSYASVTRMLSDLEDLRRRSVERLGRAA